MSSTADPVEQGREAGGRAAARAEAALEILFHSDLERVGDRTADRLFEVDRPVSVGRDGPLFADLEGRAGAPLADPCVSQQQLAVCRTADHRFIVTRHGTSRRQVSLSSLIGQRLELDAPVPPGTLIAIGDRVLLRLTLNEPRDETDRLGLVGESASSWALRERIRAVAASRETCLIHGESGVGKELVARAIHAQGSSHAQPQVVINCAAIPEGLVESELFGHVRGAFSGATTDKPGVFAAAGEGTVFLDEIGELPLPLQGRLLRVLQERRVRPVGALDEVSIRARVVAATNRDLRRDVHDGRFREDLFYRITALTIAVAPLRERREEILPLFVHALRRSGRGQRVDQLWRPASQAPPPLPLAFAKRLLAYSWPGNVRQLTNVAHRLVAAQQHDKPSTILDELEQELLGDSEAPQVRPSAPRAPAPPPQAERLDRQALLQLLEQHDYVQRRVARAAGVSHTTVNRWMRALGLRRPRDLSDAEIAAASSQAGTDVTEMARLLQVSRRGLKRRMTAAAKAVRTKGAASGESES